MATTAHNEEPVRRLSHSSLDDVPEIIEKYEEEIPTASHTLAEKSIDTQIDEKGASQIQHADVEVRNLGWNEDVDNVPIPLVGGLNNEELWKLLRRFNNQVFQVKKMEVPPLGQLDLNIAVDEEFSPEKLRAQLERFYMVTIVGLFSLQKHVVRLRSWKEYQRTSIFLAVYSVAWVLDLLVPTISLFAIILILSDSARTICFPPAPPSLIDPQSGGVKKPAAGVLASNDSVTGAPENHHGEAVEQEARNFVTNLSTVGSGVIVSTSVGKNPQADPGDDSLAPDPAHFTENVSEAKHKSAGEHTSQEQDKTKKPMSDIIWEKTRPTMRIVADFVDTWERIGNALSPTAPFPIHQPRLLLASMFMPPFLASYFISSYMVLKSLGFVIGLLLFGSPITSSILKFFNRTYPRWEKYVELRNTVLKGIPTNAQLAITLLRIGERNKAPLPPPPTSHLPPPVAPHPGAGQKLDHLAATDEEIQAAIQPEIALDEPEEHNDESKKHKISRRIVSLLRGTTKGGVHTAFAADKAKAKAGASEAKNRLGVMKDKEPYPAIGPVQFPARWKGIKGHVYITSTATTPAVSWTSDMEILKPAWSVLIEDIAELRKMNGLGWKSKLVVGWAMEREVVDGLMIKTKGGTEYHLTAVAMRDELFNRLISMGTQIWEIW